MANTFKKIQTVVVGSGGASSIEFTGIPQTYTDLQIVCSLRGTTSQIYELTYLQFNGLTTNLSSKGLEGNGASTSSYNNAAIYINAANGATSTASVFSSHSIYIPNYTSANFKSVSVDGVSENNATTAYASLQSGLWSSTAAITSVKIQPTGNFAQYSTATLYGVSNINLGTITSSPYATGGTVTSNGQYYIHTFTSDGTFTPSQSLSCEYLVVAGGGAGGNGGLGDGNGGGGGAGGYRTGTLSVTSGAKTVTVGAGGTTAANGSNSVFDSITSTGGGKGGTQGAKAGTSGGSGGGSYADGLTPAAAGTGTAGQGFAGSQGQAGSPFYAGGGGGAAEIGGTDAAGEGGDGLITTITGLSPFYAGGGAGGNANNTTPRTGGLGGGGNGASTNTVALVGSVNTGGGGGGGCSNSGFTTGGTGGSGIVIVRYTV
jgi:hypothetical protein